ncbi:MAG: MobA/MobL family protein [Janthinobacterium lividum]
MAAPNSGGSAASPPPPHQIEIEVLLPDGSCIPATRATLGKVLKQARCAALKARKAKRQEIANELQRNLEDRAAARRLLDELAGYERDHRRMAATLRARVKPEAKAPQASTVRKRRVALSPSVIAITRPASSWVIDDLGMRGVQYHQSYLSRKSSAFYRGAAADRWLYDVRDEAVVRDAEGNVVWFSNLGDDTDEIAAAWQAIEDATTRVNGKVQIRIIVPLDADASPEEQAAALRHFCERVLRPLDLPYSAVMHRAPEGGDQRNAHGHILTNLRPIERIAPYTWAFADEVRGELDGKNGVQMLRHLWSHSMSEAAERSGRNLRYTGLSYAARGLSLEAGEHLGENRAAMVARGERVWMHERNRLKTARNAQRLVLRDIDRKIAALNTLRDVLMADRERSVSPAWQSLVATDVSNSGQRRPITGAGQSNPPARRLISAGPMSGFAPKPRLAASRPVSETQSLTLAPVEPSSRAGLAPSPAAPRRSPSASFILAGTPVPTDRLVPDKEPTRQTAPLAPARTASRRTRTLVAADKGAPASRAPLAVSARFRTMDAVVTRGLDLIHRLALTRRDAEDRDAGRALERQPSGAAWRRRRALAAIHSHQPPGLIADMATHLWHDLHPRQLSTTATRRKTRERDSLRLDAVIAGNDYVTETDDGLRVTGPTAERLAVEDGWWSQDHVQDRLGLGRVAQQQLIERAIRALRLPLEHYGQADSVRWPIDVSLADRTLLARWNAVPSFGRDVATVAGRVLASTTTEVAVPGHATSPTTEVATRIADGFGGWRETPPPVHRPQPIDVRVRAFDKDTGAPSRSLLRLLRHAGEQPRSIELASDGRTTGVGDMPRLVAPLIDMWRNDERVHALVVETISASREAGRPVWPARHAAAIRAMIANRPGIASPPSAGRDDPGR